MMTATKVHTLPCNLTAMLVDFTWPEWAGSSYHELIIAHHGLRLFLLLLWKVDLRQENCLQGCHVHLKVLNTFGLSDQQVQQRLLDPWKRVVDLESVSTTGNVHPHYAAGPGGDHNSPRNLAFRRSHAVRIRQEWLRGGGEPSRILIS